MNTTVRPVVVGVIDKQPGLIRFAIEEAQSRGCPLQVVHSTWLPTQGADMYAGFSMADSIRSQGRELLDDAKRFVEHEAPDLDADYVLTSMPPEQVLDRAASAASVLIVGSDDVPWHDRLLRTKVAGHLALHAACPVVVVPELSYPDQRPGDVVLALDGDTQAEGPLRFALEEARRREAVLHVMHVTRPGVRIEDFQQERSNLSEVLAGWRERYSDVSLFTTFRHDDVEPAIVRATERSRLVVMGRPHRTVFPLAGSRAVATEVLRGAQCPVAVVPPR